MQELMVLSGNPKRRRRKGGRKARRHGGKRSRKMSALQMKYFGGGARHNPKRRRKSRGRRKHSAVMGVSRVSRRSRRRSGGRGFAGRFLKTHTGSLSSPMSMLGGALTGAIGAAAVNTVTARLTPYIPAAMLGGTTRYLTQGAIAIGLGMLASRFGLGSAVAAKMAEGSLTVTLHQALVEAAGRAGLSLGGMGYYLPGRNAGRAVPSASGSASRQVAGIGKYVTGPGSTPNVTPMRRGMGNINTFKF